MSSYQSPQENPTAWSTVLVQGEALPGVATLDFKVSRKIDEKPSPGSEVFSLTDKGAACTDVTITLKLWTPEHFAVYQRLYEKYLDPRRPLSKRTVVTVVHPELHARGIRQLYFFEADAVKLSTDGGVKPATLRVVGKEYNAKTRIGGGSSKPKPANFNAGALSTSNLNKTAATTSANTAAGVAAAPAKPAAPPAVRTVQEWRAAAAKGDPRAQFVVGRLDARAAAAKGN